MAVPLSSLLERDKVLGRLEPVLLLCLVFSVLCLESECVLQHNECLAVESSHANGQPWQPF